MAITLVIAGTVWFSQPYINVGLFKPHRPDVARLQLLADEACLCQQRGERKDCDKSYKQAIAAYEVGDAISACAPIGTSTDIITYGGEEFWIKTGYNVVANLPKGMSTKLCRKADAQAIEAAYANAFGLPIDWSKPISEEELQKRDRAANAAVVKALEAIRRGEPPQVGSKVGGCS